MEKSLKKQYGEKVKRDGNKRKVGRLRRKIKNRELSEKEETSTKVKEK